MVTLMKTKKEKTGKYGKHKWLFVAIVVLLIFTLFGGFYMSVMYPLYTFFRPVETQVSDQRSSDKETSVFSKLVSFFKIGEIFQQKKEPVVNARQLELKNKQLWDQRITSLMEKNAMGDTENDTPLSSIDSPPSDGGVSAEEHPSKRFVRMNLPEPPQYELQRSLPTGITDPSNPPEWTKTISSPPANTERPDPFMEPPIKVDPRRNPR